MKNLLLVLCFLFNLIINAQVNTPEPPAAPAPPAAPEINSEKKKDTTRFNVGDKEFLIIDKKGSKDNNHDEDSDDEDKDDDMDDNEDAKADHDQDHSSKHKENVRPGKKSKKKAANVGLLDLDLGFNFLTNTSGANENLANDLDLKFWSWSTTLNFLPTKVYLGSRNFRLMTSFGWRIGKYNFKNDLDFQPKQDLVYSIDSNIKKSVLTIHHLQIPLMLYVQSNKIRGLGRIGIGFGGYAGINVHESSDVKYDNIKQKKETEEDFGFEKYRYGLSTRVDIGALKLFANMDLSNTWKTNDIRTLECGLWFDF